MNKNTLIEKITKGIAEVAMNKRDIDLSFLIKKVGFKEKKSLSSNGVFVVIGNEGKVFDSIVAGKNSDLDKIIVLYSKKEEPFFLLLNTNNNKEIINIVEKLNKKEYPELKNKTMELNFLAENILRALNS